MAYSLNKSLQANVQHSSTKLPMLIKAVVFFTLVASLIQGSIFGINVSGLCWVLPCILSLLILLKRLQWISFPYKIWLPWIILLGLYLILGDHSEIDPSVSPLQRTIQVLTPIFVGMASSTYRPTSYMIDRFILLLRISSYILILGSVLLALKEILRNSPTGLAPQAITALLLAIVFANRYLFFKENKDLISYVTLAVLSLVALTRTVIAVMLFVFPTSFAKIGLIKRLLAIVVMCVLGVWVFYLPQVQHKMFYSGYGELSDVFTKEDFATTGRSKLWKELFAEAKTKHWAGHGTGSAETVSFQLAKLSYPHNDWLLTYYDYGVLGVAVFLLCNVMMLIHGYTALKKIKNINTQFLLCAGISMIFPFMLVMITDNMMVYVSFFGNLHYAILGFAYGALRYERRSKINVIRGSKAGIRNA